MKGSLTTEGSPAALTRSWYPVPAVVRRRVRVSVTVRVRQLVPCACSGEAEG